MIKQKGASSIFVIILVGILGVTVLGYYLLSNSTIPTLGQYIQQNSLSSSTEALTINIIAPKGIITSLVATSSDDQEEGLGDRDSLPENYGMLFAFPDSASRGFWMQGMRFPLDMVWVSADKTVAGITPNVSVDSYPNIFLPPEPVMYVLELNAGAAQRFGIATGTPLTFVM